MTLKHELRSKKCISPVHSIGCGGGAATAISLFFDGSVAFSSSAAGGVYKKNRK